MMSSGRVFEVTRLGVLCAGAVEVGGNEGAERSGF